MGIVFKQTSWNIVTITVAILIGGINTLYFYPEFLREQYYGLVVFLLATSNLLQPLMSFGAQHTIIKFFSSFKNIKEKDEFLIGEMYSRENYGILSIDKEKIILNLKDIDGNTIISEEI